MAKSKSKYSPYDYGEHRGFGDAVYPDPYDVEDEFDLDNTLSDAVADQLDTLKRNEAARAVRYTEFLLDSYVNTSSLYTMFDWRESDRGYAFWLECYNELVSAGQDTYPPELEAIRP